jgi:hypothetical protein
MLKLINLPNNIKNMSSNVSGVSHTIDLDEFTEIKTKVIGSKGRIHIDTKYAGCYILTYISKTDYITRRDKKVELPTMYWTEVTLKVGNPKKGTKAGDPLTVSKNGDIAGPYNIKDKENPVMISTKGLFAKIFVRRRDGDKENQENSDAENRNS